MNNPDFPEMQLVFSLPDTNEHNSKIKKNDTIILFQSYSTLG